MNLSSSFLEGTVHLGINNIYTVKTGQGFFECRIKGKILKGDKVYNPIAAGDIVTIEPDCNYPGKGMIIERKERKNSFTRFNKKRAAPQVLLANIDVLACVSSVESPPFRPRFIDRVLISAQIGDIYPVVIVNKCDLVISTEADARLSIFSALGYPVFYVSAKTGEGIADLRKKMTGQTWGVVGQSGVGKSSLLNALYPGLGLETGELSRKYDRGSHTTCQAALFECKDTIIIDTPGIREIDIYGIEARDLAHYFRDFLSYIVSCDFTPCLHDHEPGCRVKQAVEDGDICTDRYESYLRILGQLL